MERDTIVNSSTKKYSTEDFDVVIVENDQIKKYYVNARFRKNIIPGKLLKNLKKYIESKNAKIVTQIFFGNRVNYDNCINSLENVFGDINWPLTWIEGNGLGKEIITGTQIYAISGVSLKPIRLEDKIIGNYFEYEDAEICFLGGLLPTDVNSPNSEQTKDVFLKMKKALNLVGMDFSNVVRTWLYVHNILDWYDEFNKVRTDFFNDNGIFSGLVPASTGVGIANAESSSLVTEVFAIKSKSDKIKIEKIESPLQCSAMNYRSSFSRAVEVSFLDLRRLYISGTASIDPDGNTIYVGDVEKQISHTMEVVGAILQSRKMNWDDVSRGIAYFPDLRDTELFEKYCKNKSISLAPIAIVKGDICRNDLLFEIEIDAIKVN